MSEFERKPGAPAWQPGKEYAVWLEANASAVVTVLANGSKMAGQTGWYVHDSNILWHVELPPEPPKRLKPGLYRVTKDGCIGNRYITVRPSGRVMYEDGETIGRGGELPEGYEVLEAYAAGWEES